MAEVKGFREYVIDPDGQDKLDVYITISDTDPISIDDAKKLHADLSQVIKKLEKLEKQGK